MPSEAGEKIAALLRSGSLYEQRKGLELLVAEVSRGLKRFLGVHGAPSHLIDDVYQSAITQFIDAVTRALNAVPGTLSDTHSEHKRMITNFLNTANSGALRTHLYTMAFDAMRDSIKQHSRIHGIEGFELVAHAEDDAEASQDMDKLYNALRELNIEDQELVLARLQGKPSSEVAASMRISASTVNRRLRNIVQKLQSFLAGETATISNTPVPARSVSIKLLFDMHSVSPSVIPEIIDVMSDLYESETGDQLIIVAVDPIPGGAVIKRVRRAS